MLIMIYQQMAITDQYISPVDKKSQLLLIFSEEHDFYLKTYFDFNQLAIAEKQRLQRH